MMSNSQSGDQKVTWCGRKVRNSRSGNRKRSFSPPLQPLLQESGTAACAAQKTCRDIFRHQLQGLSAHLLWIRIGCQCKMANRADGYNSGETKKYISLRGKDPRIAGI
jgi:hypothetical protein